MDYYDLLGIKKDASNDEIKRAYRRAAHKHHPDKGGGDEEKFKQINEAYQVLSDSQKRAAYDRFGKEGVRGANSSGYEGGGYSGFEDIFSGGGFKVNMGGFGGIGDIFEEMFSSTFSTVNAEMAIPLTQALLGGKLTIKTPLNEQLTITIPPCTQDGSQFRFRGHGQQSKRGRGDLIITVRIKMPHKLNREQKNLLDELREAGL